MPTREALSLRGTAGSFSTLMRGGTQSLLPLPVRWQGSGEVFASYSPRAGGLGDISLALPPKTPPGTYEATVVLPDGEHPLVLEVEPWPRLSFHPRFVSVSGGATTAAVTALNEGNASIAIPSGGDVALYEQDEDVFERALRGERKEGERLIDRIVEGFAGTFSGTMRVTVESGDGPLAADDARELTLTLNFLAGLKPDTSYDGAWNFDGGSLAITVRTTKEETTP
ncbi:MAG: hypothetical protein AABO58_16715 [Acidobacteriota bacterium]